MAVKYDVMAVTGTYTDRQTGDEKARWMKCGVVIETDKGLSMRLDAVPTSFDGWFKLFEPRQKEQTTPQQASVKAQAPIDPELDDDLPF